MSNVRIALAQINVTVGALSDNRALIARRIDEARNMGADIVTFPELAICGYPPEDLLFKPRFLQDCMDSLERLTDFCKGITVAVGCIDGERFTDPEAKKIFNSAALIHDGNLDGIYHKVELPNYGVFDEKRYFDVGSASLIFDMQGVRFMLSVCEDIWVPGSVTEQWPKQAGVDCVLNLSASPFFAGKLDVRRGIATRYVTAAQCMILLNNLVGGQDELIFDGGSFLMDRSGRIRTSAPRFTEDLFVVDIDMQEVRKNKPDAPASIDIPTPYSLKALGKKDRPPLSRTPVQSLDRLEEIYEALVLGTRDYVHKNRFSSVALGLSGGIDSSLTAAIATDALGADHVVGVTMPSHYTSDETLSDAEVLAQNLGIRLYTVPIRSIYDAYTESLRHVFSSDKPGITHENIQARIRGNILMAVSNQFGMLVLTTGNKSETAVGYCTLYGDMAGGFAVIKDVPKTDVFALSKLVNQKHGREIIPESVIARPPSAELRPDQKDEDSLPPYDILDPILEEYVELDRAPEEIGSKGYDARVVSDVVNMVLRNEYKRRQAAPGIKITPKAFGKDRRLPITNRYQADDNGSD